MIVDTRALSDIINKALKYTIMLSAYAETIKAFPMGKNLICSAGGVCP